MVEKEREASGRNTTGTVFTFYKDIQNELDNHFTKALSQPAAADTVGASHSSTSLISSKHPRHPYQLLAIYSSVVYINRYSSGIFQNDGV